MATRKRGPSSSVSQLKITLRNYRPPIWRRVLVLGDYTLSKLHWVVQHAMGWTNGHLYHFLTGRTYYNPPLPDTGWEDAREADSRKVTLAGFEGGAPYTVAPAKLEEGPLVAAQLTDMDNNKVEIGQKVEMVTRRLREDGERGMLVYGYKFRPRLS